MSASIIPLTPLLVLDPRINVTEGRSYCVLKGPQEIVLNPQTASNYSNTSVSWSIPPPSPDTIVDRRIMMRIPISYTFTGTAIGGSALLALGVFDAPRAFPISMILQNVNFQINNATYSLNLNQIFTALIRYHVPEETFAYDDSLTPSWLDFYQNYYDWLNPEPLGGGGKNPLQGLGDSSNKKIGRGGFPYVPGSLVNVPGSGVASVSYVFSEPFMFMSPLLFGDREAPGLVGLESMQIQLTFADLRRTWSHAVGATANTITAMTAVLTGPPTILINYLSPQPVNPQIGGQMLPRSVYYPYQRYITNITNVGVVAPGATAIVNTTSINFPTIPSFVYLFLRQSDTQIFNGSLANLISSTDVFGQILSVSITFNNKPGIFASATPEQLYFNSRQRGLMMSWPEWSYATGGPLRLGFGQDIPLQVLEAAGLLSTSNYQFQATISFKNLNLSNSINFDAFVVQSVEGTNLSTDGRMIQSEGVLTKSDVLSAQNNPAFDYYDIMRHSSYGGGAGGNFFESLKKFATRVRNGAEAAVPLIPSLYNIHSAAQPLYNAYKRYRGRGITGGGMEGAEEENHGGGMMDPRAARGQDPRTFMRQRAQQDDYKRRGDSDDDEVDEWDDDSGLQVGPDSAQPRGRASSRAQGGQTIGRDQL